ncbi:MAG: DUF2470 domain-containing protein [Hyphomicrobiaceae bacterium]
MTEKKKDVLQPVDADARRLARTLVRTARYGALGTLEPKDGAPAVSRVNVATASDGAPVFLISQLSGHFTNLKADARCSLLLGEPGKGDPLAHARITLIGSAQIVAQSRGREAIKARYLMRHPKSALYADFPDFAFWRFEIARASLNGGFGKAYAMTREDVLLSADQYSALDEVEAGAVAHMNADHADAVQHYAALAGAEGAGWRLACIDGEGLDLARGDEVTRLWFETPLAGPQDLRLTLVALAKR